MGRLTRGVVMAGLVTGALAGCSLIEGFGSDEAPSGGVPPKVEDSVERTVGIAGLGARRGDAEEAIAAYGDVLVNSADTSIRQATLTGLLEVATATESSDRAAERYGEGCGRDMVVHSAYGLVVSAEDHADYPLGDFSMAAAASDVRLVECSGEDGVPPMSAGEKIGYLIDAADHYPQSPQVAQVLGGPLPASFDDLLSGATTLEEFITVKDEATTTFPGASDSIDRATGANVITRLREEHCGGYNPDWSTAGVADIKKLIVCPSVAKSINSEVKATAPEEAVYRLSYAYSGGGQAECKLYDAATQAPVYFEKGANFAQTFTLVDLRTGEVTAKKVFASTTMKCCTSGTYSSGTYDGRHHSVGTCVGGREPSGTFSDSALQTWLEAKTD